MSELNAGDIFQAIVTVFVAFGALFLYQKQKRDHRKQAASIILREITEVEKLLPEIRKTIDDIDSKLVVDTVQVLTSDSWETLKHTLAKVLPNDVMTEISEFYSNARLLGRSLEFIDSAFYRNEQEVRVNQFRAVADFLMDVAKKQKENPKSLKTLDAKNKDYWERFIFEKKIFLQDYSDKVSPYIPNKPVVDANKYLARLPSDLSQKRAGTLLRRAQNGFFKRIYLAMRTKQTS